MTRTEEKVHPDPAVLEAAGWRLVSLLFERPREGWYEEIDSLITEVQDPELATAARAARSATEGNYIRVLGPGGAVSPRQVGHTHERDPAQLIAELSTFYRAFAYQPKSEDPPDHVAVEAGFVGYMKLKEAYARTSGNAEGEGKTSRATAKFIERHMMEFSRSLETRLTDLEPSYLADAARCLARMVS
jgi:nitrate reductase assembly molybdenum cofactor insertion protein NarJ